MFTPMTVFPWLVPSYAYSIYCSSNCTWRLAADDGCVGAGVIPSSYLIPVEQFAAANYSQEMLQIALAENRISESEYNATMTYKTA